MPITGQILLPMLLIAVLAFARRRWIRIVTGLYLCLYPVAWVYIVIRDGMNRTQIWGPVIVIAWALLCIWLRRSNGEYRDDGVAAEREPRMPGHAHPASFEKPNAHELRCPICGYDRRGSGGHATRCPECGEAFDVAGMIDESTDEPSGRRRG